MGWPVASRDGDESEKFGRVLYTHHQPSSAYRVGIERPTPRVEAAAAPSTTYEEPVNPAGGQTPRTTTVGSALRRWRSAGQGHPEGFIRVQSLMFQD